MKYPRNEKNLTNARLQRKNMSPQERKLWYEFLRYCEPRFRRQELIGSYIADFFCYDANLGVEVDGSQHFLPEQRDYDNARTAYFRSLGIKVMRVDNGQVNRNFNGVCEGIMLALQQCGCDVRLKLK